jgi:5-methylcytosine-specific restriction endonuclease McrA
VTSWPASVRRRVRQHFEVFAKVPPFSAVNPNLLAEAQRLLPLLRERKAPAKRLPGESKAAKRERRRAERSERSANIRREVTKRDGGKCVLCGNPATDMHHLCYGSGMRRVLESPSTCASVCRDHHRLAHSGFIHTLWLLRDWAAERHYQLSVDALERRLRKISMRALAGASLAGAAHRAGARETEGGEP